MREIGVPLLMVASGGATIGYAWATYHGDVLVGIIISAVVWGGIGAELVLAELRHLKRGGVRK